LRASSLHDGLLAAARSSRRVLVLPLILNAAGHAKMEIPEAIEHAREHCTRRRVSTART
jgi:sirohydrochlorin cobaltochelatase